MPATPPVSARTWPAECGRAIAELQHTGFTVLVLHYPTPPLREHARMQARTALLHCLCAAYHCPEADIALHTEAGRAPRLTAQGRAVFASFSHESKLSLVAIDVHGPVGIDVLSLEGMSMPAAEYRQLARDYLPPDVTRRLAALPETALRDAFATAWTQLEAVLKCKGMGLSEWSDSMHAQYLQTPCKTVDAGPGHVAKCARAINT